MFFCLFEGENICEFPFEVSARLSFKPKQVLKLWRKVSRHLLCTMLTYSVCNKSIYSLSYLQCHCDLLTHFEVQQGVNDVNEQVHEENERK